MARELLNITYDRKFTAAFASSDIEIYPYQIAAATFAMRSPFLKGAVLCDEGSLGKTYEALLIMAQRYFAGDTKQLVVIPTPLLHKWVKVMEGRFSIPFVVIDSNDTFNERITTETPNPFVGEGAIITTYDFAYEKEDYISQIAWDISVFEEAHCLCRIYTGDNKMATALKNVAKNSFKLLLTATPMQTSIMDLYGLVFFIDETALPDSDDFYKRYFRKPENYAELSDRISRFCFRTMRTQVATYIKIPNRVPATVSYTYTAKEQKLQTMLDTYLARDKKYAFPKMDIYDLTLMLNRSLSSSTFAFSKTLQGIERRLNLMLDENDSPALADEHKHIKEMFEFCLGIEKNAKGTELINVLKKGLAELKKLGANKKAIVFTDNKQTQKYLFELLENNGYKGKVLKFSGDNSRDYTIMERFEKQATILLTTDIAAEGFDLEFCSFIINYDLPFNALTIEQRINRCQRQNGVTDVLVLNFINQNNFADVRILELINKRILQYDGIIGLSDNILGNIGINIDKDLSTIMASAVSKDELNKAFDEVLTDYAVENKELASSAENLLFTTFSKDIASSVTVQPQYMKEKIEKANDSLWAVTKYFLGKHSGFTIEEETRTIRCSTIHPPKVFTGTRLGRGEYSMQKRYKPASGRHTLTGSLARNILHQLFWVGFPDSGSIVVSDDLESCEIVYYQVVVKSPSVFFQAWTYNEFIGKRITGEMLSHEECVAIMNMSVTSFHSDSTIYGGRDGLSNPKGRHKFDNIIDTDKYVRQTIEVMSDATKEETERLRRWTKDRKIALERNILTLRAEVDRVMSGAGKASSITEKIQLEKQKTQAQKELKQREQQLFLDGLKIDVELEEQLKKLADDMKFKVEVKREFAVRVEGLSNE